MRKIDSLLEEYGSSHQNSTNKMIHWICVPAIMFSLLGLLWSIPNEWLISIVPSAIAPFATVASLFVFVAIIYYLTISIPLTFGMLIVVLPMLILNYFIEANLNTPLWLISIIVFVIAWIGQFYGHKIEGKKPSFLKDVQFLLIGPAWLMHFVYKRLGIPY